MQEITTDHLHVVVTHLEETLPGLAGRRKSFGQNVIERLAGGEAGSKLGGGLLQLFVGELLPLGLLYVDPVEKGAGKNALFAGPLVALETELADSAAIGRTEQKGNKTLDGGGRGREPIAQSIEEIHSTNPDCHNGSAAGPLCQSRSAGPPRPPLRPHRGKRRQDITAVRGKVYCLAK